MYINHVQIYGNLTRDPELKALPSGSSVANFSVATNRKWKDKDGQMQESVDYHNIVAFAKQADLIAQYLKKGSPILVNGRLQTRTWDKDGVKQYRTEVIVETFQFGPKNATAGQTAPKAAPAASSEGPEYSEEDINPDNIPF